MKAKTNSANHRLTGTLVQGLSLAGLLLIGVGGTANGAALTPGNLVVVRMGDGSAALSAAATAVFLEERTTAGPLTQPAIPLPTVVSGSNRRLTNAGSSTSEGFLTLSSNGQYLLLAGYDAAVGTTPVVSTAGIYRVVGRVDMSGNIDTTTAMSADNSYLGNNIRGATSDNGTNIWMAGTASSAANAGVRHTTFGGTSSLQLSNLPTNTRVANVFNGQLYVSSASTTFQGVSTVGSGLPTTSGQTTTILPGFPTTAGPSTYDYAFLNATTVYVADDRSAASGGGIQKWVFSAGTWSLAYTLPLGTTTTGGARGLTLNSSGANPVLYATTTETSANRLVTVTDTGAGSLFTTLATAGTNTAFRGVRYLPCTPTTWYADADLDTYGNPLVSQQSCAQPQGYVADGTDCNDNNPTIHPGAQEVCDAGNTDEDCDGLADDADPSCVGQIGWYVDGDQDGYGAGAPLLRCDQPGGYVAVGGDCDDGNSSVHPGAPEPCDGIDNDCNNIIDDPCPFLDSWQTCGPSQYDFGQTPIPAGFFGPGPNSFGPGSIVYGNRVLMCGNPLGPGANTDTVVRRMGIPAPELFGPPETVPIELVQLSLVSCAPITVQFSNGPDQLWSVQMSVGPTPPPPGVMQVTKTHANGGVFQAQFNVLPRFTFTRVNPPPTDPPLVLDPPLFILFVNPQQPAPWSTQCPVLDPPAICGVNFVPGVEEGGQPASVFMISPNGVFSQTLCLAQQVVSNTGACCLPGLQCAVTTQQSCQQQGGSYQGDGSSCADCVDLRIDLATCIDPNSPQSHMTFGTPDSPPLPADFFHPGSQPFVGQICYSGDPIGPANLYGDTDTVIARRVDLSFPTFPATEQIPIELVQLSLVSCSPIVVTGGGPPELWNVQVGLSVDRPPLGTMTVRKTHANGGTWDSVLPVQAHFTFTSVQNPQNVRVLDTGFEGLPPILLEFDNVPWVVDAPNCIDYVQGCTNFHPGIEDPNPTAQPFTGNDPPNQASQTMCLATFTGACCLLDGSCAQMTQSQCAAANGIFNGSGSVCGPASCAPVVTDEFCSSVVLQVVITDPPLGPATLNLGPSPNQSSDTMVRRFDIGPPPDGATIPTEIISMTLTGVFNPLGPVELRERIDVPSFGQVTDPNPGGGFFPADSFFDVFVVLDLPGVGLQLTTGNTPVHVNATGITELPPAGSTFSGGPFPPGTVPLIDQFNNTRGYITNVTHTVCPKRCIYQVTCVSGNCSNCTVQVGQLYSGDLCVDTCEGDFSRTCGGGDCCITYHLIGCRPWNAPPIPPGNPCVCPVPQGACCTINGCIITSQFRCAQANGYYYGDGTTCPDCNDGDPCTIDTCSPATGACIHTLINCDDGDPCTDDFCDPATGQCVHVPHNCDDGNPCTIDTCDPLTGQCVHTPINCDDGDPCTDDFCDPLTGQCVHVPHNCDDGNPCTIDTCDPLTGQCIHTPINCDDGDPCTDDFCDPATGQCVHIPHNCDDGDPCTIDTCDPLTGQCIHTPVVCPPPPDACHYYQCVNGVCTLLAVPDGTPCDDGNPNTINDRCVNGVCAGTPICPPGQTNCGGTLCAAPDNGAGTATYPPVSSPACGNGFAWPDNAPLLVAGLPPGTTVVTGPGTRMLVGPNVIETPAGGGALTNSFFDVFFDISLHGTGELAGYSRSIGLYVSDVSQAAPRDPGTPVQSFDTEMISMQGQVAIGDPDFDLLRITAGNGFGMPSPGHTTLTRQGPPGSNWAVDSFFDIEYRIEFIGAPGGPLAGRSGSTTGTIRMATGSHCVDLQTDPNNCGSCGSVCLNGGICVGGGCQCPPGYVGVHCEIAVGACCYGSVCTPNVQQPVCEAGGGVFQGAGSVCTPTTCSPCPPGQTFCGGDPCAAPDAPQGGTAVYPPSSSVACAGGFDWPDGAVVIVSGLPAGTTVLAAPGTRMLVGPNVIENPPPAPGIPVDSFFDISYEIELQGTGTLSGFSRPIMIPCQATSRAQPRTPGQPVQSFDTEMLQLFGLLPIGDPDFDLLRISAGSGFNMPSPGHTTMVQQPGGGWAVDSFFDITYRIDFIGAPGGPLAGRSGSTTATIRMAAGGGCVDLQTNPAHCGDCGINCDDGNPCTIDTCANGVCIHTLINCDDGDPCTIDECVNGVCIHTPIVCNDNDPCTIDECVNGVCVYTPINCNDNDPCTIDECVNGVCVHTLINCDDGDPCTLDYCVGGFCHHDLIDFLPVITGFPPDQGFQCAGDVPPPNTALVTAFDPCEGVIVTFQGDVSNGGAGCAASPLIIVRTYRATDASLNFVEQSQTFTVQDTIAPTIVNCPPAIGVYADAGHCTAVVETVAPGANDNCDPSPTVVGTRSDALPMTDPYPAGTTTITWTATDDCGNSSTCLQNVVVSPFNQVFLDVQLSPTVVASLSRCITFEFYNCTTGLPVVVSQMVSFTNGTASGLSMLLPCAQGPYDCVTARDRLHTLRRTLAMSISGPNYTASFTGIKSLTGGNINDDAFIDILDFGMFAGQWLAALPPSTCTTSAPHADFSGNGTVFVEDFTFIQINFLAGRDPNCCGLPNLAGEAGPITRISVAELWATGQGQLTAGDLNGDGWLDQLDVAAFLEGARPAPLAVFDFGLEGSWFAADNWGSGAVPDGQTNVVVPETSTVVVDQPGAVARSVMLRPDSALRLSGNGTLAAQSMTVSAGATLELMGENVLLSVRDLTLEAGAMLIWNGGVIQINGGAYHVGDIDLIVGNTPLLSTLRLINGAITLVTQDTFIGMSLGDQGRIEIANSTLITHSLFVGFEGLGWLDIGTAGLVRCDDATIGVLSGALGDVTVGSGAMLQASQRIEIGQAGEGMLHLESGTVVAPDITIGVLGRLDGAGKLGGTVYNAGSLAPAPAPAPSAALSISGAYVQAASGGLEIALGQAGQVQVRGAATLGGTLTVTLADGWAPALGQRYEILSAGQGVTQQFITLHLPQLGNGLVLQVVYERNRVSLVVKRGPVIGGR